MDNSKNETTRNVIVIRTVNIESLLEEFYLLRDKMPVKLVYSIHIVVAQCYPSGILLYFYQYV